MACFNLSLPRKIRNLLSKLQGSDRKRRYSGTFSWGEDIELQEPPPALLQDTLEHWNPNREASVIQYQTSRPISTHRNHPIIQLSEEITVLPYPGISYNRTPPLPELM